MLTLLAPVMYELKLLVKLFPKFSHSVTAISSGVASWEDK